MSDDKAQQAVRKHAAAVSVSASKPAKRTTATTQKVPRQPVSAKPAPDPEAAPSAGSLQPGNPMEVLGAATWLLSQTPQFRNLPISAIEALIGVPYRLGQLRLYRQKGRPFAVAAWAYLSEEVEKRVQSGGEGLKPEEWKCGDRPWLMLLAAPHGGEDAVRRDLSETIFKSGKLQLPQSVEAPLESDKVSVTSNQKQKPEQNLFSQRHLANGGNLQIAEADAQFLYRHGKEAVSLCRLLLSGPGYRGLPIDDRRIEATIRNIIGSQRTIFIAAFVDDLLAGYVAAGLEDSPFNNEKFVRDYFFGVNPDYRGNDIDKDLLAALENFAQKSGAMYLQLSHSSGINKAAADKLYKSVGAVPIGAIFRKYFMKRGKGA